jgi:YaiO family outer membrane protein
LKNIKILIEIVIYFSFIIHNSYLAQESSNVDELFKNAREFAFEMKDFKTARNICNRILKKSPNYHDVSVFLGRLYAWDGYYDSARVVLNGVIKEDSSNYDAINAAIDIEYWSDKSNQALKYVNLGLSNHPESEEYLLKKAKILSDLKRYDDSFAALEILFKINNNNPEALQFAERLKEDLISNSVGVVYDYDKFNKTFDPWQALSISYSRKTPVGSVIGRVNYVQRFGDKGIQYELDMYPRFADGFYAYTNFGYSGDDIFPDYRIGISLYYSLPYSFEIDGGFRYLKFSSSDAIVYTAALGKYYSNFWFSLRTYITPQLKKASKSFHLSIRYYLSDADEYLNLVLGTGISHDFRSIYKDYFLVANKIGLEYQIKVFRRIILNIYGGYSRDEIRPEDFRDRLNISLGCKFLF